MRTIQSFQMIMLKRLAQISKLCKEIRKQIQEQKNAG